MGMFDTTGTADHDHDHDHDHEHMVPDTVPDMVPHGARRQESR